jgi:hypothetical protein
LPLNAFFRKGISPFPHELLIELPTLNTWPFMIRNIITGNEIAVNGFLAMKQNSPMHQQHLPGRRRKGLSVNMSGFLAVAGALLIIDYSPTANIIIKNGTG